MENYETLLLFSSNVPSEMWKQKYKQFWVIRIYQSDTVAESPGNKVNCLSVCLWKEQPILWHPLESTLKKSVWFAREVKRKRSDVAPWTACIREPWFLAGAHLRWVEVAHHFWERNKSKHSWYMCRGYSSDAILFFYGAKPTWYRTTTARGKKWLHQADLQYILSTSHWNGGHCRCWWKCHLVGCLGCWSLYWLLLIIVFLILTWRPCSRSPPSVNKTST